MTPAEFIAWREAFGGRKFWMTIGAGVVCTILRWNDKIDNTTFQNVVLGTVGVYIASSVYQKVKGSAPSASG